MSKRKRIDTGRVGKALSWYNKGVGYVTQYEESQGEASERGALLERASEAFSHSEELYTDTDLTLASEKMAQAEVKHAKGKAISKKALLQLQGGRYEEAIHSYRDSSEILSSAERLYIDGLDGQNGASCYYGAYDVMVTTVLNYVNRADCHDKIDDFGGSDKWRGVALKKIAVLERSYASYFRSEEGQKEKQLVQAIKQETEQLQQVNESKIALEDRDTPEKSAWRDRLRGPAATLTVVSGDWVNYVGAATKSTRTGEYLGKR